MTNITESHIHGMEQKKAYHDITRKDFDIVEKEIIAADVEYDDIDEALAQVNKQLERYTFDGDNVDYAIAITSGILAGIIDSLFVGEFSLENASQWGVEKTNDFVLKVAKYQGYKGNDQAMAVKYLEGMFPIAADKATNDFGGGLQHHLRDFTHHPTPVGLICSILTQFTGNVYGTKVDGTFIGVPLNEDGLALIGKSFPEKITFGVINWVFHMVSDIAGSSGSIMKNSVGTGLPGPFLSTIKELSASPFFSKQNEKGNKELSVYISKLFNGTLLGKKDGNGKLIPLKFDLRTEMGIGAQIGKQTIPVVINECVVRAVFLLRRLLQELLKNDIRSCSDLDKINWKAVAPFNNRTIDRMLMISSMTFNIADTADAAVHAAIESYGNWLVFSGKFVARYNFVGAGKAALSIVKEFSNENKEAQLLHEKMILTEVKTASVVEKFYAYREALEERVSNYIAEDIEAFLTGFDYMKQGVESDNSNLVIKGNVIIQRVLGREVQFTTQEEFDNLMDSDDALIL